jgi:gluconokinase
LSEGGSLFSWMTNTFQLKDPASLESALKGLPPDGHGLTLLPFLSGERSPGWQGQARATIHGISRATIPLEIMQAGMEAVAYRIALVFDRLSKLLPKGVQVIAGGGALRGSSAWAQIISDVLNQSIAVADIPEATARGTALLAFEALGVLKDLNDVPVIIERTYNPDSGRHGIYQRALERHKKLYQKLVK